MNAFVLCGILLVGAVFAAPVADEQLSLIHLPLNDDLMVFDDNGKPVHLDLSADLPESLEETKKDLHRRVVFHLFTRSNPKTSQTLPLNDVKALAESNFNPNKETKFVTHGWINSRKSQSCVMVRDAFLKHGDYNVIVVDWSKISVKPYLWASRRVVMVSQYVSGMINFLATQGMKPSRVTFVGHSLGAHVAGLSSHYSNHKLSYVVGLDPAQPNFLLAGPGSRVARGDAEYVHIIHTNGGMLGYSEAIGDADFYPNGGRLQKSCPVDLVGACSHSRSYEYFAESITSVRGFYGRKCSSFTKYTLGQCNKNHEALMGGVKKQCGTLGTYYLNTNAAAPFAKGHA